MWGEAGRSGTGRGSRGRGTTGNIYIYAILICFQKLIFESKLALYLFISNNIYICINPNICSQLMERYNIERGSPARERSEDREEPRSHFDYRHLIPQVANHHLAWQNVGQRNLRTVHFGSV